MEMVSEVEKRAPEILPLTMDGLLSLKGLVESREGSLNNAKQETVHSEILMSFDNLLKRLQTVRHQEGEKLKALIKSQIKKVELLCRDANKLTVLQSQRIKKKLKEQISELGTSFPNLSEDRLAQEVLVLILKSDVREELDRIIVHTEAAMGLLTSDGAVGRQFDFLCQEFNREANTLCSKSIDVEITKVGLSLKTVIDQMKEQGQNVE